MCTRISYSLYQKKELEMFLFFYSFVLIWSMMLSSLPTDNLAYGEVPRGFSILLDRGLVSEHSIIRLHPSILIQQFVRSGQNAAVARRLNNSTTSNALKCTYTGNWMRLTGWKPLFPKDGNNQINGLLLLWHGSVSQFLGFNRDHQESCSKQS